MTRLLQSLAAIPPAEWAAVALALGYLLLAVRQSAWCWVCAIASSGLYLALFARGGLHMQAVLQVFYIGMAVYGWRAWRGGVVECSERLPVTRWSTGRHAVGLGCVLSVSLLNGWLIARSQGGFVPYVDALVAWTSVLATWLVARKVLENWLYWIAIDAIAAALYWSQGFHATAVLFIVYVVIAVRGFVAWRADLAQHEVGTLARADA